MRGDQNLADDGMTDRQRLFAHYYMLHGNAAAAARSIGAPHKYARGVGHATLHRPAVQEFIKAAEAERCAKLKIAADELHHMAAAIALHDSTKISQMRIGPCSGCWENWEEDAAEAEADARELAEMMGEEFAPDPDAMKRPDCPDQDCKQCCGRGIHFVWFADTRFLGPRERIAYCGASITKDGHKIDLNCRLKAMDFLAKMLGLYKETDTDKTDKVNIYFDGIKLPPPKKEAKP